MESIIRQISERWFTDQREREKKYQDAVDAIDWLASKGVVMTSGLFWMNDNEVTLIDAIKQAHADELYRQMNSLWEKL